MIGGEGRRGGLGAEDGTKDGRGRVGGRCWLSRLEALTDEIEVALGSSGREGGIAGKDFACEARHVYPVVTCST
jgi:hypothetical protein